MRLVSVEKSPNPQKKFRATFELDNGRTKHTDFGAAGMTDYLLSKDKDRRERYRERHQKDLQTKDVTRAGYLSYYLLWGPYTSLSDNITYYKRKFNL